MAWRPIQVLIVTKRSPRWACKWPIQPVKESNIGVDLALANSLSSSSRSGSKSVHHIRRSTATLYERAAGAAAYVSGAVLNTTWKGTQ